MTSVGNHTKEFVQLLDATSAAKRDIKVKIVSRGCRGCVFVKTVTGWDTSRLNFPF